MSKDVCQRIKCYDVYENPFGQGGFRSEAQFAVGSPQFAVHSPQLAICSLQYVGFTR